jgi:hypothetical protein
MISLKGVTFTGLRSASDSSVIRQTPIAQRELLKDSAVSERACGSQYALDAAPLPHIIRLSSKKLLLGAFAIMRLQGHTHAFLNLQSSILLVRWAWHLSCN